MNALTKCWTDCVGINQARHEEFPVVQTDESDVRMGTTVLLEDIVELCALYVLNDPFDVALRGYADQTSGKSKVVCD
jgi:hypothetical protein